MLESTTPQLLRINDVCDQLRMSRSSVYREIEAGKLKAFKIGKSLRINAEEVSRYVTNLESGAA